MAAPFMLTGSALRAADIERISNSTITLDPEVYGKLESNDTLTEVLSELGLENTSRLGLVIALNTLLRKGKPVRQLIVSSLLESINGAKDPVELLGLPWSSQEFAIFNQAKHSFASEFLVVLNQLKSTVSLLNTVLALSFEARNFDSAVFNDSSHSGLSSGMKSTLGDLVSLLQDSKLAKKQVPPESFIALIFEHGHFRDKILSAVASVEKELNSDMTILAKFTIKHSPLVLEDSLSSITSLVNFLIHKLDPAPDGAVNSIERLRERAERLRVLSLSSLQEQFSSLLTTEQRINESAGKPRPLPLGRGTRAIYECLKTSPSSESLLSLITAILTSRNEERRIPKLPKGMRDYGPAQMSVRATVFKTIRTVFQNHLAGELDTPVMELKETLTGKYGEEGSKLIYDLADQGGELLSLRYDLTVPFARYVAMNRLTHWKRYQIAKVYRRDQPQMTKGRYREFYQCDFDVVGASAPMLQEAEVLKMVVEVLSGLGIPFVLKVNHRKVLDSVLRLSGVPETKFRAISSSIDKLDKEPWAAVRTEMVTDKGLSEGAADAIGDWVQLQGSVLDTAGSLLENRRFSSDPAGQQAAKEMQLLGTYLGALKIAEFVVFDLSLARGLDYYTGLVYEAVLQDASQGVGSIAGGGRYDELIMKLSNSRSPVPAIGVSFGVERLFGILENRQQGGSLVPPALSVLVAQAGISQKYELLIERVKICNLLWSAGVPAETSYKAKSDPKAQAGYASEHGIKYMVWVGENELDESSVKVKNMRTSEETVVGFTELVDFLR